MNTTRLICGLLLSLLAACDDADPAMAILDNGYPLAAEPAQQTVVYRAWWVVAEFPEPVGASTSSEEQRVIPESDFAYALLAPGWDPLSALPPSTLVPVRTRVPLSAHRARTLHIVISPDSTQGDCRSGTVLPQADADFITQRIFPREFAGKSYDAASCVSTNMALERDAGAL